jgi:hypothetical protein
MRDSQRYELYKVSYVAGSKTESKDWIIWSADNERFANYYRSNET